MMKGHDADAPVAHRRRGEHETVPHEPATAGGQILAALRAMAPPHVTVGTREIHDSPLLGGEYDHVRCATPQRRREFASGRALLRDLIGMEVPIPVGKDRAPVLPDGICASLAHDRSFVVAAVAKRKHISSIGIDIEPKDPLDEDTARAVLRPDEVGMDAHLAFTLKEAAYKAWSGLGGPMLEPHDVRLSILGETFRARVEQAGTELRGMFAGGGGRWLALVIVQRTPPRITDKAD